MITIKEFSEDVNHGYDEGITSEFITEAIKRTKIPCNEAMRILDFVLEERKKLSLQREKFSFLPPINVEPSPFKVGTPFRLKVPEEIKRLVREGKM